ncbi:MAG: hypothetical protein ABWZ79_03725, partial [Pedobacter agri]
KTDTTKWPVIRESLLYNTGWELKDTIGNFGKFMIKKPVKGKGIVFQYVKRYDQSRASHGEYNEVVTWHIPEEKDRFEIKLDSFSQINYLFSTHILGADKNAKSISGTIKGVRQNENWFVTGSLIVTLSNYRGAPQKIDFSSTFTKAGYSGNDPEKILRAETEPFYSENKKEYLPSDLIKRTSN